LADPDKEMKASLVGASAVALAGGWTASAAGAARGGFAEALAGGWTASAIGLTGR